MADPVTPSSPAPAGAHAQAEEHAPADAHAQADEPAPAQERTRALAPAGLLHPLRVPAFRLLVTGQTLSTFGDLLFLVVFPFLVLAGRAGVGGLGVVMTILGISRLAASPLGGLLADRWHPRLTMLGADIGRAVTLAWLAVTLHNGAVALWQFAIVAVVLGALEGMFLPAYRAITPAVLPEKDVPAGYSVGEALNITAVIAGQLTAGVVLTQLGSVAVVGIDVATFGASAVSLLAMGSSLAMGNGRAQLRAPAKHGHGAARPARTSLRAFAMSSRLFVVILLMTGMVSVTAAGLFAVGLPTFAKERFTGAAEVYGIFLVGISVGRLVGSLAAGALVGARKRGLLALGLLLVHGAALALLPSIGGLPALVPTLTALGLADGTLAVVVVTLTQRLAPPDVLGGAMGALTLVQTGSYPVSVALAGYAVATFGVRAAFVAGGIGVLAVALFGFTQRVVRDA